MQRRVGGFSVKVCSTRMMNSERNFGFHNDVFE